MTRAKEDMQQAKATVTTGYAGEEDLFRVMENIILVSETTKSEMEAKRKRSPAAKV